MREFTVGDFYLEAILAGKCFNPEELSVCNNLMSLIEHSLKSWEELWGSNREGIPKDAQRLMCQINVTFQNSKVIVKKN